eukprot:m.27556 g.27556  ORF g.27556 m.27556 type:complete len:100 (+) comp11933_c0_seq1:71-370(+)
MAGVDTVLNVTVPLHMTHGSLHECDHILARWHAGYTKVSPVLKRNAMTKVVVTKPRSNSFRDLDASVSSEQHVSMPHMESGAAAALMACAEAQRNGEWA